jgi:hypothetical protein
MLLFLFHNLPAKLFCGFVGRKTTLARGQAERRSQATNIIRLLLLLSYHHHQELWKYCKASQEGADMVIREERFVFLSLLHY